MASAARRSILASIAAVSAGQSSSLSPSSRNNPSAVSHVNEGSCYETKCRGGIADIDITKNITRPGLGVDLCWTDDISDPTNCADGYEPYLIDDVTPFPPYNESWSYFTCCPPGYEGAIERQCSSRSCSSCGDFDCYVPAVESAGFLAKYTCDGDQFSIPDVVVNIPAGESAGEFALAEIALAEIACDDDQFSFPNVVIVTPTHMIYSCCTTENSSVEEDTEFHVIGHGCSFEACASFGDDCFVTNPNNARIPSIEPMACDDEQYKYPYPQLQNKSNIFYGCCKTNEGSVSFPGFSISPAGFVRSTDFYVFVIFQLVIGGSAVLLLSVLVASILLSPETRSDPFNICIVFYEIPGLIGCLYLFAIHAMILADTAPRILRDHHDLHFFILNITIGCSICMCALVAYQTQKTARTGAATMEQTLLHCFVVYLFQAVLLTIGVTIQSSQIWIISVYYPIIFVVVPYSLWRICKTGLLSRSSDTRTLRIYITRIVILFMIFTIVAFAPGEFEGKDSILHLLFPIQGVASAVLSMIKADVRKSVKKTIGLELIYTIQKNLWLSRIEKQRGWSLRDAPNRISNDKDIVKAAIQNNPSTETLLLAISRTGSGLQYAGEALQNDQQVVLAAVTRSGDALRYASNALRCNDEVVLAAVTRSGDALRYASDTLRKNNDIIRAAVRQNPTSLQFALGGKNQSSLFLQTSGIWDGIREYDRDKPRLILSTRFSLGEDTSATATIFALLMKRNLYLKQRFNVYFPNAYEKDTCDPNWTDIGHPCRGTVETCCKPIELKTGLPRERLTCWRFSYRYQLRNGLAMVQVVEYYYAGEKGNSESRHIIGDGQMIETEMARSVGTKIFRCFQPVNEEQKRVEFEASIMDDIAAVIEKWDREDPGNLGECELRWKRMLGKWWLQEEPAPQPSEPPHRSLLRGLLFLLFMLFAFLLLFLLLFLPFLFVLKYWADTEQRPREPTSP